eukprot:TRINITY_DN3504_c0_g1_i1.p1 TRINITY_DN3504_c0_g1~~TRINITY_DN3504_c0_g1_i1.p1  ORF type:complete len:189 (-),score=24.70 TRINITY_DN3504_c0_g1_i1:80-646(-)
MTRGQLQSKRDEFWETAPTFEGRKEIWQALRAAAESTDLELAQAILDSAEISLPTGVLTESYDQLGNRYSLPLFCLSEPTNLIQDSGAGSSGATSSPANITATSDGTGKQLALRVRLSSAPDTDVPVSVGLSSTIRDIKAKISAEKGIPVERMRVICNGRPLQDAQTVSDCKLDAKVVIQIFLRPPDA